MTTEIETKSQPRLATRRSARGISELYCLWRLCGKRHCRRARACRGDPRSCMSALPLVPPEALLFLKRMDDEQGWLRFDELIERHEEEWATVLE